MTSKSPDDLGDLSTAHAIFVAVDQELERRFTEHLREYDHIPGPRNDRVKAVPYARERIPDRDIVRMIEQLDAGDADLESIARNLGYSPLLAEREIARYKRPYGRYVRALTLSN